ncbi:MAG: DUF2807 domain-containing protein [Bacteroidales bacterium]|nr:DUF2807 domain-containing protein [Bacteroidales bacterium]MDD3890721.1 DUF2807 domain-containing protein [Bacteroidales bacterium]
MTGRKHLPYLFIVLISLSQMGCTTNHFDLAGKTVTIERTVDSIYYINILDRVNVEIIQDTVNRLYLTGPENYLPKVNTTYSNGKITIEDKNSYGWYTGYDVNLTATIHVTHLKDIYYEGIGNITSQNTLVTDSLRVISEKSSGNISLDINANYFYCYFNQSAVDISVTGTAPRTHLQINGTGFIRCSEVLSTHCWVHNQGSGDIYAYANSSISGIIEGAGNVLYTGNPSYTSLVVKGRGTGKFIGY